MKYNINDVYFVSVYVIKEYNFLDDNTLKGKAKFLKNTVVCKNHLIPTRYIDIYTNESYGIMGEDMPSVGEAQINIDTLDPITNHVDIEKIKLSRNKIMKKVRGVKK
ncbi:MAG: hypothetical protein IJ134_00460 [Bacilli bacterium]|nr:hypothetical protein [Bacilli bacterium]